MRISPRLVLTPALLFCLPAAAQSPVVLQTGTHVVTVNVVVKDKHGNPVDDLTRDDFVLRDNSEEQKITYFAPERTSETLGVVSEPTPGLTFSNRLGPNAAPVTVFLFDELNTKLTDQELAKQDFVHYLRELPPESRVAVFVLGGLFGAAARFLRRHEFSAGGAKGAQGSSESGGTGIDGAPGIGAFADGRPEYYRALGRLFAISQPGLCRLHRNSASHSYGAGPSHHRRASGRNPRPQDADLDFRWLSDSTGIAWRSRYRSAKQREFARVRAIAGCGATVGGRPGTYEHAARGRCESG